MIQISNYIIFLVIVVSGCLCQDNATTTLAPTGVNATTTTTLAPNTTALPPTTNATTTPVPTQQTTNATTETPTTEPATTMNSTTAISTTAKPATCTDPQCPPYSMCDTNTKMCLFKCPNVTNPSENSTAQICGSDGKTYESMDKMKSVSCDMKQRITKNHDGACAQKGEEKESSKYIIIVVVLVLVLIIIIGIAAYWIYNKRRSANSKDLQDGEKAGDNLL